MSVPLTLPTVRSMSSDITQGHVDRRRMKVTGANLTGREADSVRMTQEDPRRQVRRDLDSGVRPGEAGCVQGVGGEPARAEWQAEPQQGEDDPYRDQHRIKQDLMPRSPPERRVAPLLTSIPEAAESADRLGPLVPRSRTVAHDYRLLVALPGQQNHVAGFGSLEGGLDGRPTIGDAEAGRGPAVCRRPRHRRRSDRGSSGHPRREDPRPSPTTRRQRSPAIRPIIGRF